MPAVPSATSCAVVRARICAVVSAAASAVVSAAICTVVSAAIWAEVKAAIDGVYDSTSIALTDIVQEILDKLGAQLPKDIKTKLPPKKDVKLSWEHCRLPVFCQSWPTQDAIDYASFLVYMQSARAKFVPGVATVGGRTHIGVLTKSNGFTMLNEPELKHRNVGFLDDL